MSATDISAGGSSDLLRRATQALMMSKTAAAADDDGADQLGFETPRSGVATPQPDLHDKRLPGIMSYFGQVGTASSQRSVASPVVGEQAELIAREAKQDIRQSGLSLMFAPQISPRGVVSASDLEAGDSPPRLTKSREPRESSAQKGAASQDPYPTPPSSQPSSARLSECSASCEIGEVEFEYARPHLRPAARSEASRSGRGLAGTLTGVATNPIVSAHHPSNPHTAPPPRENPVTTPSAKGWFSFESIKMLTKAFKSGPPTPTRALSAAQPSQAEEVIRDADRRNNQEQAEASRTVTPGASAGAHVPAPKGRLKLRVTEARGLKKSGDPYVVAVFQRSEHESTPPQEDDENTKALPIGGMPIQRQASDSGRPPMAIPMRSRQSSNTSISDYTTFRNRAVRKPVTNPKWDAHTYFDVVDANLLMGISVYGHNMVKDEEEFLGHVTFSVSLDKDTPIKGWFPLRGNADTMAENTPTGEVYVEAVYLGTGKRHYGPEDFQILKLIGKGTFGQVYQVRKKDTQRIYAMKVLSKKVIVQKKEVAHTLGERNILVRTAMSDSPFIVGLKFSFQTPSDLYLVTDYMSGGELFWHLQKEGRFDEKRAKFYIAELILAIQHLHDNGIVYRDLKPENILLDANGHIALCDFGLSKADLAKNDTTNTFCGTTEYLAPEVLLDESGYTKMVDFWSLGVLVFEMCCGWSPFYAEDTQQMYKNIAFGKVRFPRDTLSADGRNFVKGLLNRNPKHRLGATDDAEELKRHDFFSDIDWDLLSRKLITPPFKPKLKSETDVSYFDPEFTNALDTNGSLNERAAALARGAVTSTPLSPSVQANFQGFTYVADSALEDHMRDRPKYDDEEMNDANAGPDDDWDSLDDIDLRQANRMSGIVRTTTNDEHMVGGTHFDVE